MTNNEFIEMIKAKQEREIPLTDAERSHLNSLLRSRNPPKQRSDLQNILAVGVKEFGQDAVTKIVDEVPELKNTLTESGMRSGVRGLSTFLATDDLGKGLIVGAGDLATQQASKYAGENFGKTAGQITGQVGSGIIRGALTGDYVGAAEDTAVNIGLKQGGQMITDRAISSAVTQATSGVASKGGSAAAQLAAGEAAMATTAASMVPIVGGLIGGVTGFLSGDTTEERTKGAAKGAMYGSLAAAGPYGWAAAGVMAAGEMIGNIAKAKKNKRRDSFFTYDAQTGKMSLVDNSRTGSEGMSEFNSNEAARVNLHRALKDESDRRVALAQQATEGMPANERDDFIRGLGDDFFNPIIKGDQEALQKLGADPKYATEMFASTQDGLSQDLFGWSTLPEDRITDYAKVRDEGWTGTMQEYNNDKFGTGMDTFMGTADSQVKDDVMQTLNYGVGSVRKTAEEPIRDENYSFENAQTPYTESVKDESWR